MEAVRKPFQGVWNIVRFNWHYYILVAILILLALSFKNRVNYPFKLSLNIIIVITIAITLVSLVISSYIYDFSGLYKFSWLKDLRSGDSERIVNINAGFDETSVLLEQRFKNSELIVADFYDPAKHTEISLQRARKAYPPFQGTQQISTEHLPMENNSVDKVFLIFAAHEIRNDEERIVFFKELDRVLKSSGQIIVTEHLRDLVNFLAYNIGFFHFHSRSAWMKTFNLSGFKLSKEIRITPFITTFILEKNGTAS